MNIKEKFYKKTWFKILAIIILIVLIIGGFFAWKTGSFLNKISDGNANIFSSLVHSLPGVEDKLKGEDEGRINVILLGMRGENMEGGGLLTDTIMVASFKPEENKVSLVSIPRDLWVNNPGWNNQSKINAVYAAGQENGKKEGMRDLEKIIGEVSGLDIHYGVVLNFEGFREIVDSLGGVDINLDTKFVEAHQFRGGEHRCDDVNFTVPTGKVETKKITRKNGTFYFKEYPLCFPPKPSECGGIFEVPAGSTTLDGEKALCFVRARENSTDFDRAKRQQLVLKSLKNKALSIGTLTNFEKLNGMLEALGSNIRTDMQAWEMKRFFEIAKDMENIQITQRVLENSEEGLLYAPEETKERGYILLPRGDNFDRIHELFQNIFSIAPQSDINPLSINKK